MGDIKVSILLITYNRANFLPQAIDSALSQSFKEWELIVVDSCSTDNTTALVEEYIKKDNRIRYYKNLTDIGIGKSRNLTLDLARGKYVAILDSDDYWADNEKLQKQFDLLDDGGYVLVGGGCQVVDENGNKKNSYLNPQTDREIRNSFLIKNPFVNSSVMFLKEAAKKTGGYDESMRVGEDYELFLRLGKVGKMMNIPSVLVNYRKHSQNISQVNILRTLQDNVDLIKRYKNDYPNYFYALLRRLSRLYLAKLLFIRK